MRLTRRSVLVYPLLALPASAVGQERPPLTLVARPGPAGFAFSGRTPDIWGYDGTVPGPVLRVRQNDVVRLRFENGLPLPTALHWHGLRGPNPSGRADVAGAAIVAPGASADVTFTARDAGTFWYRPDVPETGQQARGLFGLFIVDEREAQPYDDDIAVVLADMTIDAEGRVVDVPGAGSRTILTVDGRPATVERELRPNARMRLRLLNASVRHTLPIDFGGPATIVARDGQPAEPVTHGDGRYDLGPGNRIDVGIDAGGAPETRTVIVAAVNPLPILRLRVVGEALRERPLPAPAALPPNPIPARLDLRRARRAAVSAPATGGSGQRLFQVRRGTTVVLTLDNPRPSPATFHVHGHALRPLDRLDDGWKPWFVDSVQVDPGGSELVAFVAETPGRWLIERRSLGEVVEVGRSWFEVT